VPEDAGALLVRSGLIASDQLLIARQAQAGRGGTIGEHLVLAGFIDDDALAEFYRSRLMVPQVKPEQLSNIADWLIAKIPAEMAAEFRCVPVACEPDRHLTLAMADPSTTHAVDEISFFTGHYVVRAVATQRQIAWCLARYYGQVTPLAEKMMGSQGAVGSAGRLPSFPMPGAAGPEKSGPVRRRPTGPVTASGTASRGPRPQTAGRPRTDATPSGGVRAPTPAPRPMGAAMDDDGAVAGDISSPVPVIIESDRPEHPSRRPYVPPETREPMISFLHEETAPTGPMRMLRRPTTQPPELQDRAGEFEVPTGPIPHVSEPLPPVVISPLLQSGSDDSQPTTRSRRPVGLDAGAEGIFDSGPDTGFDGVFDTTADPDPADGRRDWRDSWGSDPDLESEAEVEYEMDYLPAEELALPPPAGHPTPLPPAPEQAPGARSRAAAELEPEPVQYETSYDELDEVVLLDRPKPERRRHRRTRIGLGIQPSTLSRLTGNPHPGPDAGAGWPRFVATPVAASAAAPAASPGRDDALPSSPAAAHDPGAGTGSARAQAPASSGGSIEEAALAAARDAAAAQAMRQAGDVGARPGTPGAGSPETPAASDSSQAVPRPVEDEPRAADARPTTSPRGGGGPGRRRSRPVLVVHGDELDEARWGPPGSTIPPQFLGPQVTDQVLDSGPSPVPLLSEHLAEEVSDEDIDQVLNAGFDTPPARDRGDDVQVHESQPLAARRPAARPQGPGVASARSVAPTPAEVPAMAMTAPPVPGPVLSFQGAEPVTPDLVRELEDSSLRLVEILRELDQAYDRNGVVDTLIAHLSESHGRVAFFVVKSGELTTWKQRVGPGSVERRDGIKLSLDEPSTFQDIVGTRLPFRGPLTDPVSRAFVAAALGFSAGQMLALPVSVRGRVVGILYGDSETRRVFEQHLAVVTRAAGVALERILRARKGQ
jgi:hypothetical protein